MQFTVTLFSQNWQGAFIKPGEFIRINTVLTVHLSHFNTVVVVVLLFYVHGKHLKSCGDGQFFPCRLGPPNGLTSASCTYFGQ